MSTDFFQQLQAACALAGLRSWIESATQDEPIEQMHVLTGVDGQGRNYMLRLMLIPAVPGQADPDAALQTLDMGMLLPFQVEPRAFNDTARLLSSSNLGLPIGGFGLVEHDRVVMLRHVWHAPAGDFTPARVIPLIDMLGYVATESAPMVEQVAAGAMTYEHIMQTIQKAAADATEQA